MNPVTERMPVPPCLGIGQIALAQSRVGHPQDGGLDVRATGGARRPFAPADGASEALLFRQIS